MRRALPAELGPRLATRRPLGRAVGAGVVLVPALVLPAPLLLLDGGAVVAAAMVVLVAALVLLILGESLAFRHHVHEHGIVTESTWPYRRRVIPFYSVEGPVRLEGYHRTDGTWKDARDRRFRQVPTRPTLRVNGLRPDRATALATGRTTWNAAPYEPLRLPTGYVHGQTPTETVEWVLGWPRGVDDTAWIDSLVEQSRRTGHM